MTRNTSEEPRGHLLSLSLNYMALLYLSSFDKGRTCHLFSNPRRRKYLGDPFLWYQCNSRQEQNGVCY